MKSRMVWAGWNNEFFRQGFPQPAFRRFFIQRKRTLRGQATLEMLVVLLFLIPLIFGAIEISRGVAIRAALDSGIGVAVRALSLDTSQVQWDWAQDRAEEAVVDNVFGTSGVGAVTFQLLDEDGVTPITITDLENKGYSDGFCLAGQVSFSPSIPLLPLAPIDIGVRHCGIVDRMLLP
jgi:Flp pilus assembly protein TadG